MVSFVKKLKKLEKELYSSITSKLVDNGLVGKVKVTAFDIDHSCVLLIQPDGSTVEEYFSFLKELDDELNSNKEQYVSPHVGGFQIERKNKRVIFQPEIIKGAIVLKYPDNELLSIYDMPEANKHKGSGEQLDLFVDAGDVIREELNRRHTKRIYDKMMENSPDWERL